MNYSLNKKLHQRAQDQKVLRLLTEFEDELKQERIQNLEQEQKIQALEYEKISKQRFFLGLIVVLMFIILAILYRVNQWRAKVNEELNELNNTKDKLFSIIAHDLKNPLSAFRSITQALSDDIFEISREDLDYFIKQLNNSAHSLFELLQNLLYWSISQSGKLEFQPNKFSLKSQSQKVVDLLQGSADIKQITVNNNIPITTEVFADSKMFETVLRNLVANAIKFTPHKGNIDINSTSSIDMATITVTDSGIGMTKEQLNSLFKIGSSQEKKNKIEGQGTGLGLILCKELTERQGGKIWVESTLDKGTIFSFTVPIKKA